jgi:alpha-L-fucosidase
VTTQKGNQVYVHVLDWNAPTLALPSPGKRVRSARLMRDGSAVKFEDGDFGLVLRVPQAQEGEIDRVVVLTLAP